MPRRSPRGCSMPGCPELVEGNYSKCIQHRSESERARGAPSDKGYDRAWRQLRKAFIRAHPWCADPDKIHPSPQRASHVDHVVPIVEGGARLDRANCQSLCISCHSRKTAHERNRRGSWG